MIRKLWLLLVLTFMAQAAEKKAPLYPALDDRYKTDLLVIIAHPDDETAEISGYLARAIYDEHRRVSVIFTTRGEHGISEVGPERGNALGAEREIEGRRALAFLGVTNVWFLNNAPNAPVRGDVRRALEFYDHGSVLAQVVRLIRLTRPEVILTWLPAFVAGENHDDHQAAGVLATEAFDLAGDPTSFAEQVTVADDEESTTVRPESLHPWQPEKIYYYSDSFDALGFWWSPPPPPSPFRRNFLDGAGPEYSMTDVSPSQHLPYSRIAAKELSFYITQDGEVGKKAMETGDFTPFQVPARFVFGKSVVGGSITADIFEGVTPDPIPFVRAAGFAPHSKGGLSLEFGGPWEFYHEFWKAHDVERLAQLLPIPETSARLARQIVIPLVIQNHTRTFQQVTLKAMLPEGWTDKTEYSIYPLRAGDAYPVQAVLISPNVGKNRWEEIHWNAEADGQGIGNITLRICLREPSKQ